VIYAYGADPVVRQLESSSEKDEVMNELPNSTIRLICPKARRLMRSSLGRFSCDFPKGSKADDTVAGKVGTSRQWRFNQLIRLDP
jgi:hypothetical protein